MDARVHGRVCGEADDGFPYSTTWAPSSTTRLGGSPK
jgi:hypothetical protein